MGSRGVFQPVGQKRLTNIAVVRLKKAGLRFEVACYRNKVQDWRTGIEKDIDEVLQTTAVFTNVSKAILAKDKELQAAFGSTDQLQICLEILSKGDVQVAEEERKQQLDNTFRDVAGVLAEKCVNPDTGRPYTLALIERALRDVHFNVDPKRSAKQQALEALPALQAKFPIQRARMRLKVVVPAEHQEELQQRLDGAGSLTEACDQQGPNVSFTAQVEPGLFRELHTLLGALTKGRGRVEVLSFAVTAEGASSTEFGAASIGPAAAPRTSVAPQQQPEQAASGRPASSERASSHAGGRGGVGHAGGPGTRGSDGGGEVVYPRGPVAGLPDEHAARRERFAELDSLQPGWRVELRRKGDAVEAVFFPPGSDTSVGAYAVARRQALAASKAAAT